MLSFERLFASRWFRRLCLCLAVGSASTLARADTLQTCGILSQGTRWETPYYVRQSDQPGPTVVILSGIHRNEPAGAEAADQIRHWPIRCGTLAVLPRANPSATAARTRPDVERPPADLNRDSPRAGQPEEARDEPTRAIWAWVQSWKPDCLLDLDKKNASSSSPPSQPLSRRVRQHRLIVQELLTREGLLDPNLDVDRVVGRRAEPDKTWVALYDAGGTGGAGGTSTERILAAAGMRVRRVGPEEVAAGSLGDFDLVVFPGGSGSKQAAAIREQGRRQVESFVEGGGGYLGICAGAYLCTSGFDWGLKILDARTVSPKWQRGRAMVKIELTPKGRTILGDRPGLFEVRYANGPIIAPAQLEAVPDYEVLAFFRSEVTENGTPVGVMMNSPAIAIGHCGQGRVVFISPHPEQTKGLEDLVLQAARWAAEMN